jgi:hypothetical protein
MMLVLHIDMKIINRTRMLDFQIDLKIIYQSRCFQIHLKIQNYVVILN